MINLKEYDEYIKNERNSKFDTPYQVVYDTFIQMEFANKDSEYFEENASSIVERLRNQCWENFLKIEKSFTSEMLNLLCSTDEKIKRMNGAEAVEYFVETYPEHIYKLTLSNTQSRRARAGKEFEAIIEMILIGANIQIDSQGSIGKKMFTDKNLGKLVDLVSPGVTEYFLDKNNTILISAKTSLRERWQEVPEEISRTGASQMYLATLDKNISLGDLNKMYEANVILVTTAKIKENSYKTVPNVITFERLISLCKDKEKYWSNHTYSESDKNKKIEHIQKQMQKYSNFDFIEDYYYKRLSFYDSQDSNHL